MKHAVTDVVVKQASEYGKRLRFLERDQNIYESLRLIKTWGVLQKSIEDSPYEKPANEAFQSAYYEALMSSENPRHYNEVELPTTRVLRLREKYPEIFEG